MHVAQPHRPGRFRLFGVAAGGLALALLPQPLLAATATATTGITATVEATCLMTSTALAFGTYAGAQLDSTATLTVTCTDTTPYDVAINEGLGVTPTATVTTRHMTGAAGILNYALFNETTRTTNWGVTATVDTIAGTGDGTPQDLIVYGRIAAGQFVTPGAYTDTVTATVTY